MNSQTNIDHNMDSLVDRLSAKSKSEETELDSLKALEVENSRLLAQLYRYAEDFQTLLVSRNKADINELEKDAAYRQLERFNQDFMLLMAEKEKSYRALEASHLDTIRRLATAAEFKDDDTGVHIVRMSRFSAIIPRA